MFQAEMYRNIARTTGESVSTIKRVGFLIADPSQPISDPEAADLGPHVIDWDEFEAHQEEFDATSSFDFAAL